MAAVDPVQRFTQFSPVGQVAVVRKGDAKRRVHVKRLGFFFAGAGTSGGITYMADTADARQRTHVAGAKDIAHQAMRLEHVEVAALRGDRKSTRLNSSH